jgi:hypothetical protein
MTSAIVPAMTNQATLQQAYTDVLAAVSSQSAVLVENGGCNTVNSSSECIKMNRKKGWLAKRYKSG